MTVGFIAVQTARGVRVSLLWFESLMIVLAHYFASRRLVQITPELREQLIARGALEAEPNPLYLPRHSLRLLIVAAFAGLAWYLWRQDRLFDPVALPIFIAVGSYFLGIGFGAFMAWRNRGKPRTRATVFDNWRAAGTIAAVAFIIVVEVFGLQPYVPYADKLEALPLALMLFYFGSR